MSLASATARAPGPGDAPLGTVQLLPPGSESSEVPVTLALESARGSPLCSAVWGRPTGPSRAPAVRTSADTAFPGCPLPWLWAGPSQGLGAPHRPAADVSSIVFLPRAHHLCSAQLQSVSSPGEQLWAGGNYLTRTPMALDVICLRPPVPVTLCLCMSACVCVTCCVCAHVCLPCVCVCVCVRLPM